MPRWSFGELVHGLQSGRLRVPTGDSTETYLYWRTLVIPRNPRDVDVTGVLNALMDEQLVPRVVLWHRPGDERDTSWVVGDSDGIAVVALALITKPQPHLLNWFLDVTSWRFEDSGLGRPLITWLPIQALYDSGLRERWTADRSGRFPTFVFDRIEQVAEELLSRPVETDTTAGGSLSRLATTLYPPREDGLRGFPTWRTNPDVRAWSATTGLLTSLFDEPDTAPWPAQEKPPAEPGAYFGPMGSIMDESARKLDPAKEHRTPTGRPGYPPAGWDEFFVCALAAGGRLDIDVVQSEFGEAERVSALHDRTAVLIAEAVDFLREDCEMPHQDLMPDGFHDDLFPTLVRYVALHGRPTGIAATRLRQWYWRWISTWRTPPSLPDLLANIDDDPVGSAGRLLAQAPGTAAGWMAGDLPTRLIGPGYLLALLLARPRDLTTGADLTTTVTRSHERLPLRNVLPEPPLQALFEGQIIQHGPAKEPIKEALLTAPEEIAASHLLDAEAITLLRSGDHREFLAHRAALISRHAVELVLRLTGWPAPTNNGEQST